MSDLVKVTYDGVEITYNESRDRWTFELRGRERSAESLAKAKEAIDKPEPKEKAPFARISAYMKSYGDYMKSYGDKFQKVEVTSVAEDDYGTPRVWTVRNGDRRKERADSLYCANAKNESLIAEYEALQTEIKALEEKSRALVNKMETIKT
jgi:hypothetical protein